MLVSAGGIQVTSIAIKDGTIYGIGNDKKIYEQILSAMSTSPSWVWDSAGDIMSIAIKDDTIYGIGTDKRLYKLTLSAMSTSSSKALASAGDV